MLALCKYLGRISLTFSLVLDSIPTFKINSIRSQIKLLLWIAKSNYKSLSGLNSLMNSWLLWSNHRCKATFLNTTAVRNKLLTCDPFVETLHIQITTPSHFYITGTNISGQCHHSISSQWLSLFAELVSRFS